MSYTSDQRTSPSYTPGSSTSPQTGRSSSANGSDEANSLRAEFNALKDQMSDFMAKAGSDAMRTARQTSADVATQVQSKASDLASAASEQAKTLTSELERIGRNNPLGAIAGALLVGVVIGLFGRRG